MKTTLLSLVLLITIDATAQGLKKYPVSNSGCFIYSYCDSKYDVDKSEDSSLVYTGGCAVADITYGTICIKLLNPVADLTIAEDLVISYLDYLKLNFEIKKATGYGKGHYLNSNEKTRGILDYWEDASLNKWKIKAWTDGKFIGIMYAFSKKELPEMKINAFLDSFRMPGM